MAEYDAEIRAPHIAYFLSRMLSQPANLFPYGIWNTKGGILGATPELLFEKSGNKIRTMALAGTRKDHSSQRPLLEDTKQVWEHHIVVQDIRDSLSPLGALDIGRLEILQLPGISHLRTPIDMRLHTELSYADIVRHLHPTPALGASPRGAAQEIFRMMDRLYNRRRFGAPFGFVDSNNNGTCLVAIRNLQWEGQQAFLAVGCGVVADSSLEEEWAELDAKESAIRRSLGL
jgi:menaquinone-specific isochorismate synthase